MLGVLPEEWKDKESYMVIPKREKKVEKDDEMISLQSYFLIKLLNYYNT